MPAVSDLSECPLCFGRLLPLSVCQSCNTVEVRDGLEEVGPDVECEDCGASNPTHFVCSACNARFPFQDIVKPEGPACPACRSPVTPRAEVCPNCGTVLPFVGAAYGRSKRSIRGEYGEEDINEVARIPNVGRQRAEALCKAGYNRLWKIQQAPEGEIAKVPGIGAESAAHIREALRFLLLIGQPKTKDDVLSEEYECPLCGTVTSLFATKCHDCGATFDREEIDGELRKEVERDEEKGLLAYYDMRLFENADDLSLLYARASLLLASGHPSEALTALDAILQFAPGDRRALQAKARALEAAKGLGAAAQVLRQAVGPLPPEATTPPEAPPGTAAEVAESETVRPAAKGVATSAADRDAAEMAAAEALVSLGTLAGTIECPECGEPQQPDARICSACGHRLAPDDKVGAVASERPPTLEEEHLLNELERAIVGEDRPAPPPLEPEVSPAVIAGKRSMLVFLSRVPGVSKRAAGAVCGFFQDIEQVGQADVVQIGAIPGVAPAEARLIKVAVVRFLAPEKEPAEPPVHEPPRADTPEELEAVSTPISRASEAAGRRPPGFEGRRGLVNGTGLVDGRGRVNGLVNGTGFVDGVAIADLRLPRKSLIPRYVAIGAALLIFFSGVAVFLNTGTPAGIRIDGNFGDWAGHAEYVGGTPSANLGVEIAKTSVVVEASAVFLRIGVQAAQIFANQNWETMYAFLDVDGDDTTGYDMGDLGADYAVRVSGSDSTIGDARLLKYDGAGRARNDWAGFATATGLNAATAPTNLEGDHSQVEISVPRDALEGFSDGGMRVRFASDDNAGETSHTMVPVGKDPGALLVEQSPETTTLGGGRQPFLTLTFLSLGGAGFTVNSVFLVTRGGAIFTPDSIPSFEVPAGSSAVRTVSVDAIGLPSGTLVTAVVTEVQITPAAPFAVVGPGARAYVTRPPPGKVIDGLFDDWPSPSLDSDPTPVQRRSMNILSRDGNVSGNRMSFYAKLGGDALEGTLTPDKAVKPPPAGTGGSSQSPPAGTPAPLVGQDYIRFFVDTDARTTGGFEIGGVSADRMLQVRGREGRPLNATVYRLVGPNWVPETSLDWGLGGDEIEVGVTLAGTVFNETRFAVVTSDWAGIADRADVSAPLTRGDPGLVPLDGTNFLTAIAKPLTNTPTVDGNCGSTGTEYEGSDTYSNSDLKFLLGRRSDAQFVYVCLEITSDTSDNTADWGELLFDQEHDDTATPQDNDRRFRMTRASVFTQEKGDATNWVSCGGSCDGGNTASSAFNNSKETYEFKIRFSDIWGSNSPEPNERAGFAVVAHNDGVADYPWGSDTVNQTNPSTWGRLEIPEFRPELAASALVLIVLAFLRRRRR